MKSIKCSGCGLVMLASASTCKRCGGPLEVAPVPQVQTAQADEDLAQSIKTKQSIIYGVGLFGTTALSITAAVIAEDTGRMVVLFAGILIVGFLGTFAMASMVKSRMLAGRDEVAYAVTPGQKVSVLTSSLLCAGIVLNSDYGFIISPLIVVIFNGALYLYDRQMKSKQNPRG